VGGAGDQAGRGAGGAENDRPAGGGDARGQREVVWGMNFIPIGDVSDIVSKGTTPTSVGLPFSTNGIPFLKGEDVLGKEIDLLKISTFISEDSHRQLNRSELVFGDVLITIAGTIGRIGFIDDQKCIANCNQAVAFVRSDVKKINPEWLCYLLQSPSYQTKFSEFVAGGAIPNVSLQQIRSIELPDIAIEKQRQIAARLKAQLAEVDTARQATEAQLRELNFALNQIIEEQITGVIAKGETPVKLGEVSSISAKIVNPTLPEFCDLPHVSAENIESMTGRLVNIKSAKEDGMTSGKYLFDDGDILYSKLRPYLRKVAKSSFNGLCSADMYPIKVEEDLLNIDFLQLLLTSNLFTDYANEKSARSRMPKLNRQQLFEFEFSLPSIRHQHECVSKISEAVECVSQATRCAKTMLNDINLLPQKILAQAFEM
jgi:type I restriction enzyme S subunit